MIRLDRRTLLAAAFAGTAFPALASPSSRTMMTRPIARTTEALPVIGMGTWQTFDVGSDATERAALTEVLRAFAAAGARLIDASPMYGSSESVAGDLTRALGLRNKLFLATKVWTRGKDAGIAQMNASMQKLAAGPTIDLMQVHNLVDVETHLATLAKWKDEGRVRYVGVTHYTASAHDAVAEIAKKHPIDFVQINYSVGEREAERALLPLCKDRGISVIANRPFAGGELIRALSKRPLPEWAAEIDCTSWAQLLLKFVISHPAITAAIPATSKAKHMADNAAAGSGRLPDARLRERIAQAI